MQPKFAGELAELRRLKADDTGDTNAVIHLWDWRYYENQLKKQRYNVDAEALRVYFPYQAVLEGMFDIYQRIFGLRFEEVNPPAVWAEGVQLYAVLDAQSGEPLGLFYLDMFPREGKYNHFAHFGIVDGKRLPDGMYQRPVSASICNFPPPQHGEPSLLSHEEVETLFHEFGHAMHATLTRAKSRALLGNQCPAGFCRGPVPDAGELGLGQKRAGWLRRRLSGPDRRRSRPKSSANSKRPGNATHGHLLPPATRLRPASIWRCTPQVHEGTRGPMRSSSRTRS